MKTYISFEAEIVLRTRTDNDSYLITVDMVGDNGACGALCSIAIENNYDFKMLLITAIVNYIRRNPVDGHCFIMTLQSLISKEKAL